jgi:hypothetical protein
MTQIHPYDIDGVAHFPPGTSAALWWVFPSQGIRAKSRSSLSSRRPHSCPYPRVQLEARSSIRSTDSFVTGGHTIISIVNDFDSMTVPERRLTGLRRGVRQKAKYTISAIQAGSRSTVAKRGSEFLRFPDPVSIRGNTVQCLYSGLKTAVLNQLDGSGMVMSCHSGEYRRVLQKAAIGMQVAGWNGRKGYGHHPCCGRRRSRGKLLLREELAAHEDFAFFPFMKRARTTAP